MPEAPTFDACGAQAHLCGAVGMGINRMQRVVEAARALRDSGYDGPMISDEVVPLFAALAALDGKQAEQEPCGKCEVTE